AELSTARAQAAALAHVLHEEYGLRGNFTCFDDPRNSLLNDVLERRLGIPISLGLVYIEVARRLGLSWRGVCFPGYFLVRLPGPEPLFLDPAHPFDLLEPDDCRAMLDSMSQGSIPFSPRMLQPAPHQLIVLRMLRNLKRAYLAQQDL